MNHNDGKVIVCSAVSAEASLKHIKALYIFLVIYIFFFLCVSKQQTKSHHNL